MLILSVSCDIRTPEPSPWEIVEVTRPDSAHIPVSADTLYDFHLTYCFAGLGSNMGTKQPYFEICDSVYTYTHRLTSKVENQPGLTADTLAAGVMRKTSIDSIIDIADRAFEKKATRLNFDVPDGGLVTISIKTDSIDFHYSFQNCSDGHMKALIAILSTYVPDDHPLILYDLPCDDDLLKMVEEFEEKNK